jgi:hypothetical protein
MRWKCNSLCEIGGAEWTWDRTSGGGRRKGIVKSFLVKVGGERESRIGFLGAGAMLSCLFSSVLFSLLLILP